MFIEHRFSPVYNMTHIECFNEKKKEIMIKRTKLKENGDCQRKYVKIR